MPRRGLNPLRRPRVIADMTEVPITPAPGDEAGPGTPGTGENICPGCNGTGLVGDRPCPTCEGSGRVIEGLGGG